MAEKRQRAMTLVMHSLRFWLAIFLAATLSLAATASASAQIPSLDDQAAAESVTAEADPYSRGTPRAMATAFIAALAADDSARLPFYFEGDSASDTDDGIARADRLQFALDNGGLLAPFAMLSNAPIGRLDDGLPPEQEQIGSFKNGDQSVPIILSRTDDESGPIWRISQATIDALPAIPDTEGGSSPAPETEALIDKNIAGAPAIDWLKLLGIALLLFAAIRLLLAVPVLLAKRISHDHQKSAWYNFFNAAAAPLSLYLAVLLFFEVAARAEVAIVARQALTRYAGIVGWVAFAWFVWRLINAISGIAVRRMQRTRRARAGSLIIFARRAAKVGLISLAAIAVLDTVGLDVTTGIAALGIGGLALALGAQKTIENLVGSLTVILDAPIAVGDFCQVGDVKGTVIDIGMRSTRIRTNERTIVAIPNGDFAARQIENYSKRDKFLFDPTIGITYDANPDILRKLLQSIRELLASEEAIIDEDARVRFFAFGDSSLDIEIFAHANADDYPHSLEIFERLMLGIMDCVKQAGADFAFPTRTLHFANPPALSAQPA